VATTPPVTVADGATVESPSAYAGAVTFAGLTGTLLLDDSPDFTGTVVGMTGADTLDLRDITASTNTTLGYSGDASGGKLSVSDGGHSASIALLGNYLAATFAAASDGHGGTSVNRCPGARRRAAPRHSAARVSLCARRCVALLQCMSPVLADFVAKVFLHWRSKILLAVDAAFE
jgi:hypothetical protein